MKQLTTHTDTDKIIAFLQDNSGNVKLSKKLEEKLERFYRCSALIKQYGSRLKVCPMLEKEFGISKAQAYRDFSDTQQVFGESSKGSREFWLDIILGMMMETRKRAKDAGDNKTAAAVEKNMVSAVKDLLGDKENDAYENLQPVNIMMGFFPETLKTELPDDLEDQIKNLLKPKRNSNLNIEDAKVVDDEE